MGTGPGDSDDMNYYDKPDRAALIQGIALAVVMAFLLIIYVVAP